MERERSERTWRPGERRVRPRARPPAGRGRGPAAAAQPRPRASGGRMTGIDARRHAGGGTSQKGLVRPRTETRAGRGKHGGEPGARWRGSAANGPGGRGDGVRRPAYRPGADARTVRPRGGGAGGTGSPAAMRSSKNKRRGQVSARRLSSAACPPDRASACPRNRCRAVGRGGVRVGVHFLAGRHSRPCIGVSRGDSRRLPHTRRPP